MNKWGGGAMVKRGNKIKREKI